MLLAIDQYEHRLTSRIHEIIDTGCNSLTELCQRAGGAFPTEIVRLAGRSIQGLPTNKPGNRADLVSDSAPPGAPEPHPIDFEWRFAATAADALATDIAAYPGRIACFGTPGVFWRLARSAREVVLYDRNPKIRQCLEASIAGTSGRIEIVDLNAACPVSNGYEIVLMDPPWYLNQFDMWLRHASRIVSAGGLVVTSLFPPLLRPGARYQRRLLKERLLEFGVIGSCTSVLYSTPRFEQVVLEDAGLGDLGDWRMGELLWVTVGSAPPKRDSPVRHIEPQWERFQLGRQIIAVRSDNADSGTVRLRPVGNGKGYLLCTVSSRAPERSGINVWTSRNLVANATGIPRIIAFLRSLETGSDPQVLLREASEDDQEGLRTLLALVTA